MAAFLSKTDLAGATNREYIFLQWEAHSTAQPPSTIRYFFSDNLGSHTIITSSAGAIQKESDYYPYGGEILLSKTLTEAHRFTGKERDSETCTTSCLDNFGARYHGPGLGRFMSPDPVGVMKQKFIDPQQWNMYAYTRNNPLRYIDPTGKWNELTGTDEERRRKLAALQQAVGDKKGNYLYDNLDTKTGKHFVGIYTNGNDGKSASFRDTNAAANKLGGIIQDQQRGATIEFESPGTVVGPHTIGSLSDGRSPAATDNLTFYSATIHVTSGKIGTQRPEFQTNGKAFSPSLADVISHELGHIDSTWYHYFGPDSTKEDLGTDGERDAPVER